MKPYAHLIIGFLVGALAVSAGWGGAVYAGLMLFGLLVILIVIALVWNRMDLRKAKDKGKADELPDP